MANNNEELLINPADFDSMSLKIDLLNLTTHAEIRDGKRCFGKKFKNQEQENEEKLVVQITEFLEDGLLMEIPSKTCAENHLINIEVSVENANPPVNASVGLKVISKEKLSSETDLIETAFMEKNDKEWSKIVSVYQKRQGEIIEFINAVKGYESA